MLNPPSLLIRKPRHQWQRRKQSWIHFWRESKTAEASLGPPNLTPRVTRLTTARSWWGVAAIVVSITSAAAAAASATGISAKTKRLLMDDDATVLDVVVDHEVDGVMARRGCRG
jgi:hypothetical protein